MKGFIDLVFRAVGRYYLVDWKSNRLAPQTLRLYARAPRRGDALPTLTRSSTCSIRSPSTCTSPPADPDYDYERDFGGVFYVFLRGVREGEPGSRRSRRAAVARPRRRTVGGARRSGRGGLSRRANSGSADRSCGCEREEA